VHRGWIRRHAEHRGSGNDTGSRDRREIRYSIFARSSATHRQSMGARELKTSDVAHHSSLFDFLFFVFLHAPTTDDARLSLCFGGPGPVRQVDPGQPALPAPQHGLDPLSRPHLAHGPAHQRLRSLWLRRCGCGCAELPRPDIMPSTGAPATALMIGSIVKPSAS
jgi:hypothetical protein